MCQAKFLTCEISDFMACEHVQSNILHIKYAEKPMIRAWCLAVR